MKLVQDVCPISGNVHDLTNDLNEKRMPHAFLYFSAFL